MLTQISDMTHEELAIHARRVAAHEDNDELHDLAIDLQNAVNAEEDSEELAEKVIEMLMQ